MKNDKYIIVFDSEKWGKGFTSQPVPKEVAEKGLQLYKEKYGNDLYNCGIIKESDLLDFIV